MKTCSQYQTCNVSMCPRDIDLGLRTWIPGEDICRRGEFSSLPWIKRQKAINRRRPQGLEDTALTLQYLTDTAPNPRKMTPEQREKAIERLNAYRSRGTS